VAIGAFIIACGVILSTLFIKQHYIADEIAGVALALTVGSVIFKKLRKTTEFTAKSRQRINYLEL
jgi:membrane-associated phospholipid phosphatase